VADSYRVIAHNTATESENRIHADDIAKDFGFRGGLVPGVDVYAYMTHLPAERWGLEWLEGGTMRARFVKPVYDGEQVIVEMSDISEIDGDPTADVSVRNEQGDVCATGSAGVPTGPRPTFDLAHYPSAPLPERPPAASAETLLAADPMGSIDEGFHLEHAPLYLDDVRETLPIYLNEGIAHPGWLLRKANDLLALNVVLGPWIHTESRVHHLGLVHDGDRISTRGRTTRVYERKGHHFVALDVLVVVGDSRPVIHIEHCAIYEPRRGDRT